MSLEDVSRSVEGCATPSRDKARYSAPVLKSYGNIAELTRSGTESGIENSNGSPSGGGTCAAGGNANGLKRTCVK